MAFLLDNTVLDAPAAVIDGATALHICTGTPTDFATATGANSLATVAVSGADFTEADHPTSGRQVTVAAKPDVPVGTSGTAAHYCLVNADTLLAMTEVDPNSPDLTEGSTGSRATMVRSLGLSLVATTRSSTQSDGAGLLICPGHSTCWLTNTSLRVTQCGGDGGAWQA